jgi:uroporphyrinogen decarboxylase
MTSLERVLTALNRQEPDRVPTFEWDIDQTVIEALCPGCDLFEFIEQMDLDGVVVGPDYRSEDLGNGLYRDEWGVVRQKGKESYAIPIEQRAPLRSARDFWRYVPPDPLHPYRFDTLNRAVGRFKGSKAIIIKLRDGFSTPRDLLGYTAFLLKTLDAPKLVKELVEIAIEHNSSLAREAIRIGADIVVTGDDYADIKGPLTSPRSFENLFLPALARMADTVHQAGARYIKHTDGNIRPLLGMLVEAGIDCLDPIDPLAGMDLQNIKACYGAHIALKGNIDCAGLLSFRTAQEVELAVKQCIREAAPGGGYILSSSNSIHSGVKPLNYRTMLDTLRACGSYPIQPC